jgi:ABC-type transport system substrate-binding protein
MNSHQRIVAVSLAILVVSSACGAATSVNDEIPFAQKSYPAGAAAPCVEGTPGLSRIESTDEHTVVFTLCEPDVAFLQKIAISPYGIDDSAYLAKAVADGSISQNPNGTGPFAFSSWDLGTSITLERNENYWGEKAKAASLVFQWNIESSGRLISLQSATADAVSIVSPSDYATVTADPALHLVPREPLGVAFLGFNSSYKPFDDLRVRKAIALTLDRKRILDTFYPIGSTVAPAFTPCAIEFACGGDAWYTQDLEEAKALLTEAGFPNGFETTLAYRNSPRTHTPFPMEIATDIQSQLAAVGIVATLEEQEATTFIANATAGKLTGLFLGGFNADYPDASNFMNFFFGAQSRDKRFGEKIPSLTEPIAIAGATGDATIRAAKYAEANSALKEAVVTIPLIHGASAAVFLADVQGTHTSPVEMERISVMTPGDRAALVWVLGVEPAGLYCPDESDADTFRVCAQISEGLYGFATGKTSVEPRLATACVASKNLLTWTCDLRKGVTFHDGSYFDATDVVDSFAAIWDCAHPLHVGRTKTFKYWGLFSGFLNPEACNAGG